MNQADGRALQLPLMSLHKSMPRGVSKARPLWLLTPNPWTNPGTRGLHVTPFLPQNFHKALTQALPPAPVALTADPRPNPENKTTCRQNRPGGRPQDLLCLLYTDRLFQPTEGGRFSNVPEDLPSGSASHILVQVLEPPKVRVNVDS